MKETKQIVMALALANTKRKPVPKKGVRSGK